MRVLGALGLSLMAAVALLAAATGLASPAGGALTISVLSSQPDLVSGGDALIEINRTSGDAVRVTVDGRDVTSAFHRDPARESLVGLVEGLRLGRNALVATAGRQTARLQLVNHAITGPILSGDH